MQRIWAYDEDMSKTSSQTQDKKQVISRKELHIRNFPNLIAQKCIGLTKFLYLKSAWKRKNVEPVDIEDLEAIAVDAETLGTTR